MLQAERWKRYCVMPVQSVSDVGAEREHRLGRVVEARPRRLDDRFASSVVS